MRRHSQKAPMGIRTTAARVQALTPRDETLRGTYWFDLRTRCPARARIKRAIDLFGAVTLIVLLGPLMLLVAALIRLTSSGPALFVQRRIGFRCNEFEMYRFRTMKTGELQAEVADGVETEDVKPQDTRITPLGRFLRRYSLDELPQLFNVLEGSMSLVGPRPLLVSDLDRLPIRGQMRRFTVPPGITGLWQVGGRSTTDEERMQLDREYINNWSLVLDFKILTRTIGAVFGDRGAAGDERD